MIDWFCSFKGIVQALDDLLTTRQLQDLLQVDRVTIYRMLSDGRLRGFKVGGQWRFSRQEIESWLHEQQIGLTTTEAPPPPNGGKAATPQALPVSCVQAIQSICAEALDIAAITTDLEGTPLTPISNSCDFCNLILATEEGHRRCTVAWRMAKADQFHTCHAGLLCASAPVEVSGQQVAIASGCQFAAQTPNGDSQFWLSNLSVLAAELGLAEGALRATAGTVRLLPDDELRRVLRLLHQLADTLSEIGQERLNLLSRLQHIAEMSKI
jgi:excisionase family DNA binding protein